MANKVREITFGIDVGKDELVICQAGSGELTWLDNNRKCIRAWLRQQQEPICIAIEPTSHYHLELVEQAHAYGVVVYLVNPRQLKHYRKAVGERNKTDAKDAALLARYLLKEREELRPFKPRGAKAQRLWALIKRRGTTVRARQQLQQSLSEVNLSAKTVFSELKALLARIDRLIRALIKELGWQADYQRCLTIPGIGPDNAAALTAAFNRGAFAGSDAFVAFLGIDIRLRESGRYKGQSKLSKYGESEARRLLFCATQAARNYSVFDDYYHSQIANGRSKIATKVALMRKLTRIAFSLMSNKQNFIKIAANA